MVTPCDVNENFEFSHNPSRTLKNIKRKNSFSFSLWILALWGFDALRAVLLKQIILAYYFQPYIIPISWRFPSYNLYGSPLVARRLNCFGLLELSIDVQDHCGLNIDLDLRNPNLEVWKIAPCMWYLSMIRLVHIKLILWRVSILIDLHSTTLTLLFQFYFVLLEHGRNPTVWPL